jgi:type III secretion protein L
MSEELQKSGGESERVLAITSAKVVKRETYEATREAQDIVAQAQAKAVGIIEDAERKRELIFQRAEEEGRTRGLAAWNEKLAKASQRTDQITKSWEQNMVRISVKVAEKIIGDELKLRPEAVADIVQEALRGARPGKLLTIHVNAADVQQVRAHLGRIREQAGVRSEMDIAISTEVAAGGCIVESELGVIDARLETQLQCLEEILLRGVAGDPS